jgi:hypothetical protein
MDHLETLMKGAQRMLRDAEERFRHDPTDENDRRVRGARMLIATVKDVQRRTG